MSRPVAHWILVVAFVAALGGGIVGASLTKVGRPPATEETSREPAVDPARIEHVERRVEALVARLDAVERVAARRSDRDPAGVAEGAPDPAPAGGISAGSGESAAPDGATPAADRVAGWIGRTFRNRDADELFGRLALARDEIDPLLAELEKAIAAHPDDADLRVALATVLQAKTAFATTPGPEQGVVWQRAEDAYAEAIRLDPNHWQAHFGRAFGNSMAPEFVGLRPKAIEQFEALVRIQESGPSAPEHVKAYQRLGTLYKDAGNAARAREVWARGTARFPDDTALAESLRLIGEGDR